MPVEWWEEEAATSREEVRRRHADNRASWEVAAATSTRDSGRCITDLRAGRSNLHPIERRVLSRHRGRLRDWCRTAIHLQCASGYDTLSLWLEGAQRVVGVDFSETHIRNARSIGRALGAPATWYACDVLDTPHRLDANADLVYTGRGAIGWLHDLDAWAAVVHRLLVPGGCLSLFDDHPCSHLFDADADELAYSGVDYFRGSSAGYGFSDSFVAQLGVDPEELPINHDRLWTFAELFGALTRAGLQLLHLGEHPEPYWDAFPNLPPDQLRRIPQTFSLLARRPPG